MVENNKTKKAQASRVKLENLWKSNKKKKKKNEMKKPKSALLASTRLKTQRLKTAKQIPRPVDSAAPHPSNTTPQYINRYVMRREKNKFVYLAETIHTITLKKY